MKEFLLETQELLQRLQESNPPKRQNWAERQTLLTESWEEQRSTIFKELLEATYAVPENIMCSRCLDKAAVVRCDMCSTIRHLCPECDQQVHESWPFHDRDAIVNGHYFPIPATTTWNSNGQWEIVGNLSVVYSVHLYIYIYIYIYRGRLCFDFSIVKCLVCRSRV